MINKLIKILKSGYNLFWQEKLITFTSLGTTIIVSLFLWFGILSFYFFNQMINYLQERLDFSIYFKPNVLTEEIMKIQKILQNFPQVEEVTLINQEQALEKFKQESRANPIISRALSEININPLTDYLIVKAKSSETYLKIIDYLEKSPYKNYIDYINYYENQIVIQKIINLSNKAKILIFIFILSILILSAFIIFNFILVSIYSQKENFEILRLIGANNFFIRGPFLIYSLIFSFVGYLFFVLGFIIFLEKTENFWPSLISTFHPVSFIHDNFFILNGLVLGIILFINWVGTFLALQRYLKI